MGLGEKTPLRGSEDHVPYVFMSDPNRAYKKKVRLLQCYLCSAIIGVLALALLVSVVYSVDNDMVDGLPATNGSLSLQLKSPAPGNLPEVNELPEDSSTMEGFKTQESDKKKLVPIDWKAEFSPCSDYSLIKPTCLTPWQRSADGFCNNLNHPMSWGVSGRPFKRLLPADYCDGLSSPRCASTKQPLPLPLTVGSKLQELMSGKVRDNNMILMLWGHYIYQDLVGEYEGKGEIDCCSDLYKDNGLCFPIEIPMNSSYYRLYNTTCLPFVRSKAVTCPDGQRAQLNKATSYLDGSVIYGSTKKIEKRIRSYSNGQLQLYITPENKYLSVFLPEGKECNITKEDGFKKCPNEAISCISGKMNLPSINLLFAKQHNFIASQLGIINPLWDDETIFQATKKIISAQIQHITYNEFLETIVGNDMMKSFGDNSETGYYEEYDINTDASVSDAFPAVFRLINAFLPENSYFPEEDMESQPCNLNMLGEQIQRSRDHGLPGYTKWREYCHLGTTSNFSDLSQALGADAANILQGLYSNVTDIDLVAGLVVEMYSSGNILGPVGTCIVSEQLKRTKTGDRFWYETSHQPENFNPGQLAEIHKTTLSRIICDHSKALKTIQYNSMMDTDNNPTISCYSLPSVNLSLWEELPLPPKMLGKDSFPDSFNPNAYPSSETFMKSGNDFTLQAAKGSAKSDITKKATSFTVNIINATITKGSELIFESYGGKPPFTIPLDSFTDTSGYNPSAMVSFSASYEDDLLQGTASLSVKDNDFFQKGPKKMLNVNFTAGISIKWGGSFTHDPKRTYNCKLMFQSYAKLASMNSAMVRGPDVHAPLGADESGETCNILAIGTYYRKPFYCPLTPWWCKEGLIFYWSGEAKLIFVKPNPVVENKVTTPNSLQLSKMPVQKPQMVLGKTGDTVTEKTFASVTVVQGKITGQFNGEEAMDVMTGGPPIDIYLDNFVDPRGFDASTTATWSATPIEDNSIVGTFSVPYYPSVDNYSERRKFTANFSVALIYKYGGSIGIIDPKKTYTCKVMFQAARKSTLNSLQSNNLAVPVLGKTPFGESCSITISGKFYQPSVLCFWCTKAKIFTWSGDIELALKYKYNATDTEMSMGPQKQLSPNMGSGEPDVLPTQNSFQDNYSVGHRYGGRVISGWIQVKTGGFFSVKKTIWSGEIPFEVELPLFWNATSPEDADLSDTYGHAVLWSGSIFHSAIQGTFSFPQFIGHGPAPQVNWISGKFSFEFAANPYVSLYDLVVPGLQYQSNLYFRNTKMPDDSVPFSYPKVGAPTQDEVSGVRAPIILLGRRTDSKHFLWNGTFIINFSRTAKDLYYG